MDTNLAPLLSSQHLLSDGLDVGSLAGRRHGPRLGRSVGDGLGQDHLVAEAAAGLLLAPDFSG
jgi:hypothetical protein